LNHLQIQKVERDESRLSIPFTTFGSIRLLDKSLKGVEIFLETHEHDIVMGSGRNDEKFLLLCPEVMIEVSGVLERDEPILFPMDDQGRKEYLLNTL